MVHKIRAYETSPIARLSMVKQISSMVSLFLFCFLVSFVSFQLTTLPHDVGAVTGLGLVGAPSVSIGSSASSVDMAITPTTAGSYVSGTHNIITTTNVPTGYTLTLKSTPSPTNPSPTLSNTTGTITSPVALTDNSWGFALTSAGAVGVTNGFDASYAVPTPSSASKWANPSSLTTIKKTSQSATNDTTAVFFGAKVNLMLPSGAHSNIATYTVLGNVAGLPAPTISSIAPATGDSAGGQSVTIVGTGFTVNDKSITSGVTIGGSACTQVSISSNTPAVGQDTIYCKTPEHVFSDAVTKTTDVVVSTWVGNTTLQNGYTYTKEIFEFTVDTRMTDTLDTASDHYSGTAKTFYIPVSGYVNWSAAQPYNWIVNCGDGTADRVVSGTGSTTDAGIECAYAEAGEYQILIAPVGHSVVGWMNAFGFHTGTSGANSQSNKNMFKSIDADLTPNMRRFGSTAFQNMFYGAKNATAIPATLFENVPYVSGRGMAHIFRNTFFNYGYNSTSMTIPAGLFNSIDISTSTSGSFEYAFGSTFSGCAYNSTVATIPSDLFSTINTSKATSLRYMYVSTFANYGYMSSSGTIPSTLFAALRTSGITDFSFMFQRIFDGYASQNTDTSIPDGLFSTLDTSSGTTFTFMFGQAFYSFAQSSTTATIPSGLFSGVDTSRGTNLQSMFANTFAYYGRESAVATIPDGLLDGVDTAAATDMRGLFQQTFFNYGRESDIGVIPEGLFDKIDTSNSVGQLRKLFYGTFQSYAYANKGNTYTSDINLIWGDAILTGVTADNVGGTDTGAAGTGNEIGVFYRTFYTVPQLRGSAQTFITNKLGGITPTVSAQTFSFSAGLSDYATIDAMWKS